MDFGSDQEVRSKNGRTPPPAGTTHGSTPKQPASAILKMAASQRSGGSHMSTHKHNRVELGTLTLIGLVILGVVVYKPDPLGGWVAGVVCIALGLIALTISVRLLSKAIRRKA